MQQRLAERAAEQKQEAIANEIFSARQRSMADAERYRCAAACLQPFPSTEKPRVHFALAWRLRCGWPDLSVPHRMA
jgi:hypothetical protein